MKKSPEAFRTISEVAEWLGTPAHVLRFWESRFAQIKPVKRAGGRRYYRPSDMALLGGIRKLLHDDGMTIRGVKRLLQEKGIKHVAALSGPIDEPQTSNEEAGLELDAEPIETNIVQAMEKAVPPVEESPAPAAEEAEAPVVEAAEDAAAADDDGTAPELPFVHHERPRSTPMATAEPEDPADPDPAELSTELPAYTAVIADLRRFARLAGTAPLPSDARERLVGVQKRLTELRAR